MARYRHKYVHSQGGRMKVYSKDFRRYKKIRKPKTTYGTPFPKKTSGGKHRKGTMIRYKYVNGRRVGAVKSRK